MARKSQEKNGAIVQEPPAAPSTVTFEGVYTPLGEPDRLKDYERERRHFLRELAGKFIAAEIAERGIIAMQKGYRGGSAVPDVLQASVELAIATLDRIEEKEMEEQYGPSSDESD